MSLLSREQAIRLGILLGGIMCTGGCDSGPGSPLLPTDDELLALIGEYESLPAANVLQLADESEPGQRLTILARLVRAESGTPIGATRVQIYQADASGSYDENEEGVESAARISGTVMTDSGGRFKLHTVLPGDYRTTARNRHIHTTVSGADPEAYDFYFSQFVNDALRSWAESSTQAVLVDLHTTNSGALVGKAEIQAQRFPEVK